MLAPTRRWLRTAVKAANEVLGSLWLLKHPDKTFVGRIARGFDFLGYRFGPNKRSLAPRTIERFVSSSERTRQALSLDIGLQVG